MYSETNRRASVRRSNDEFLRRMIGGELVAHDRATMNSPVAVPRVESTAPGFPTLDQQSKTSCDGTPRGESAGMGGESCPLYVKTPSLAMVYAPRQCWQNLFEPQTALANGTLFADLVLPFEAGRKYGGTEGGLSGK